MDHRDHAQKLGVVLLAMEDYGRIRSREETWSALAWWIRCGAEEEVQVIDRADESLDKQ